MDIILKAITPILTTGIQTTIIPIIEDNLTKLDEIEGEINTKIDELTGQVKDTIDKIPEVPFIFTKEKKAELLAKLPFEKVDEELDKIDLSAIEKIEIPSEIDADGKIKEKLTQFPEKIKSKLKSSIRAALSGLPSSTTTSSTSAEAPAADNATGAEAPAADNATGAEAPAADNATGAEAPAADNATSAEAPAIDKDIKITSEEAANILEDLKKTLGPNVFDALIAAAGDIKAQQGSKGVKVVSEAKNDAAGPEGDKTAGPEGDKTAGPEGDKTGAAKGGAKKRRRKTKKNIRRPKKSYTKFGRKF
jgi:hypothetical protein